MKIIARGWRRDHGEKEVAFAGISDATFVQGTIKSYAGLATYLQLLPPRIPTSGASVPREERDAAELRVRVSVGSHTGLNLNGRYLIECAVTKSDAARLFHLTHATDSLDEIVAALAALQLKRFGE